MNVSVNVVVHVFQFQPTLQLVAYVEIVVTRISTNMAV
jgi:hypothetical protein